MTISDARLDELERMAERCKPIPRATLRVDPGTQLALIAEVKRLRATIAEDATGWEYGVRRSEPHESGIPYYAHTTSDTLDGVTAWKSRHDEVVRRRKAGPWEVVQGER